MPIRAGLQSIWSSSGTVGMLNRLPSLRCNKFAFTLGTVLVFASAGAHAWLFGPKTYEECIIDGAKSAKTNDAMSAIRSACFSKFQEVSDYNSKENINKRERGEIVRKKCRLELADDLDGRRLFSPHKRPSVAQDISNLKSISFDPGMNAISFQNNSRVPIAAVIVGFGPVGKNCSFDHTSYQATLICGLSDFRNGIPRSAYGSLPCQSETKRFRGSSYCIIGIGPATEPLTSPLSDVMNQAGWCE